MSPRRTRARVDPGPAPLTVAEQKLMYADVHLAAMRMETIQSQFTTMLNQKDRLEKVVEEMSERQMRRFNAIELTQADAAEVAWITLALLGVLIVAVTLLARHAAASS